MSGRRACPPEEVGGPRGYGQRTLDQFSWRYESLDRLLAGEDIREDDVPTWFWTYRPEHFDKDHVNRKLAKLYQLNCINLRVIPIFCVRRAATTTFSRI